MISFHEQAKARAATGDAAGLFLVGHNYAKYRETNPEPWQGADDDLAAILEGFNVHKGHLQ